MRGGPFRLRALHRHQAEFGGDEEAVRQDEKECRTEQQEGDHAATAALKAFRAGAALVLQDDSSIAGKSHSSGCFWSPRSRCRKSVARTRGGGIVSRSHPG